MAGREPDREVTAGRVAARDDPGRVDVVDLGQPIEARSDVGERAGPPTALLADAPVLEVPGGDPLPGEVAASGVISVRSHPVRQKPPWSSTTHGHGPPSAAGRCRFATWSG